MYHIYDVIPHYCRFRNYWQNPILRGCHVIFALQKWITDLPKFLIFLYRNFFVNPVIQCIKLFNLKFQYIFHIRKLFFLHFSAFLLYFWVFWKWISDLPEFSILLYQFFFVNPITQCITLFNLKFQYIFYIGKLFFSVYFCIFTMFLWFFKSESAIYLNFQYFCIRFFLWIL